jgi:hypothetical protein
VIKKTPLADHSASPATRDIASIIYGGQPR